MTTSFAALASQFLNRQQNGGSSMSSSQPMFFSFTTGSAESRAEHNFGDNDLNDLDDPHLKDSAVSRDGHNADDEDDDPYLRLDEEEQAGASSRYGAKHPDPQSRPLITSEYNDLERAESSQGWLAHQATPLRYSRSPSPAPSDSTESAPPPDLFRGSRRQQSPIPPPPLSTRAPVSLSLTDSLLPRDGRTRPLDVFSLPDPRHVPRGRRKHNDYIWTAVWLSGVSLCFFFSVVLLFTSHKPERSRGPLPYTTLLHTVPLITILTFVSAAVAYVHIFLLRIFVRPVMIGTSVFIPATLFISAIWAFVGSFMWDADSEPTWGETMGLRLFSLVPLLLSFLTAQRLLHLPRDIHATSATLNLTTQLLIANPLLLALSPSILLISLLISMPFVTLIFRLLLIGYFTGAGASGWEWHVQGWANWAIAGTSVIWLWTWGVARGTLRMTCASVIGSWYFSDPDMPPPPPMSTHTIHAAVIRSTDTSIGTICLSALILTAIRFLTILIMGLERLPVYLPARLLFMVSGIRIAIGFLEGITTSLSKYALVYTGLTGDAFMPSARRARALTSKVGKRGFSAEPPLTLLTVAPLTLTFPFALSTYLFVAHTLNAPDSALGAAVLAGSVTALVGLFCVGLVKDTADTLYVCYCIDKDMGERKRQEVFEAFEYGTNVPQRQVHTQEQQPLSGDMGERRVPVVEDVDPFEASYMHEDSRLVQPILAKEPLSASSGSGTQHEHDDSEEEDDVFPGSGLF